MTPEPLPRDWPWCWACGKKRRRRRDAKRYARRLSRRLSFPVSFYWCDACGAFHVGKLVALWREYAERREA